VLTCPLSFLIHVLNSPAAFCLPFFLAAPTSSRSGLFNGPLARRRGNALPFGRQPIFRNWRRGRTPRARGMSVVRADLRAFGISTEGDCVGNRRSRRMRTIPRAMGYGLCRRPPVEVFSLSIHRSRRAIRDRQVAQAGPLKTTLSVDCPVRAPGASRLHRRLVLQVSACNRHRPSHPLHVSDTAQTSLG